jgi:HEAT repeat protein
VVVARDAFKDKHAPARAQAAALLADDHEPAAVKLLEGALHDRSSIVRAAAAKSLGKAGNRDTISKLATPMRDDPHHAVRYAAAASIIRLSALPQ